MSKKARRGMHIRINWPILRLGVPEDFSNAESLTLHISRVNNNVKTFIPDTFMSSKEIFWVLHLKAIQFNGVLYWFIINQ